MLTRPNDEIRLAIVQHGDYSAAFQTYFTDQPEPYAGMKSSVKAIEQLIADRKFLLVSLDAPAYRLKHGDGTLLSLPVRQLPRFVPRRIADAMRCSQVLKELRLFAPTHVLLRTSGRLALDVLRYCEKHSVNTLVVFANFFNPTRKDRRMTQTLVQLLNQPFVHRVGNHRQPATDSMIEYGLSAEKATAYDFDVATSGHSSLPKSLRYEDGCTLVFAGSLIKSKGCEDVILAVAELLRRGQKTRLTIFGDGPERQKLEQLSLKFPAGTVTVRGRRPNEEVLEAMRTSTFVCVTTHSEFPEGMPLALTESLSSGTPVIASMHPVFVRAFRNGEGLQFVPEKQPNLIADAIWQLWNDRTRYDQLSRLTLSALERVRCTTLFADLLQEWKSQRLIDAGFLDVAWERHSAVLPQECQHTTGDEINPFTA